MSRAKGTTLRDVYDTYTIQQKQNVANQLGSYMREWRKFTSPIIAKVDGTQLDDEIVGYCDMRHPACKKIGFNEMDW